MRKCEGSARFRRRLLGYIPARIHGYNAYLREFNELRNSFCDALECSIWNAPDSDNDRIDMGLEVKTIRVPFEGRQVPAPENYDTWLRAQYGDYMQLPPEDQRVASHAQDFWWVDGCAPSRGEE